MVAPADELVQLLKMGDVMFIALLVVDRLSWLLLAVWALVLMLNSEYLFPARAAIAIGVLRLGVYGWLGWRENGVPRMRR